MKQTLFNKNFISLWTWDLFTLLVVKLRGIIIPLVILNATSSSQTVASVSLVQQVVIFSLMIPVGAWVERRRKIKTAVIFRLLYGVGLFLLAVVLTVGGLNITLMTGLLVFVSVCGMVASTSFNAMIPQVAGRSKLLQANTYLEGAESIATLIGPAIGGYLLGSVGVSTALFIASGVSIISTICAMNLTFDDHHSHCQATATKKASFWRHSLEGFNYLRKYPQQVINTLIYCVLEFSTVYIEMSLLFYTTVNLNLSENSVGIIFSSAGIGTIVSLLMVNFFKHINWVKALMILLAGATLGTAIMIMSDNHYMIGLGMAIFDGSLAMGYIIQSTIHQGLSPDNILARAGSAYYLIGGLFSMIGTAAAGLLPDLFNGHIALMIGSVVLGIIACAMYLFRDYGQPVDEIDLIVLEEK